jgi:hypothetical protein
LAHAGHRRYRQQGTAECQEVEVIGLVDQLLTSFDRNLFGSSEVPLRQQDVGRVPRRSGGNYVVRDLLSQSHRPVGGQEGQVGSAEALGDRAHQALQLDAAGALLVGINGSEGYLSLNHQPGLRGIEFAVALDTGQGHRAARTAFWRRCEPYRPRLGDCAR